MNTHLPLPTARQFEILERTLELVAEAGLANLTLKKVAGRVGFTEAAIYRHFANKRELILGLIGLLERRLLDRMHEIAGDRAAPPAQRLEQMMRHHLRLLIATRGLPLVLIAEGLATGDRELVDRLARVLGEYRGLLAAVLGELRLPLAVPGELQALLFLGLPAAAGILMRAQPDFAPTQEELDRLVHYYVAALTAPQSARGGPFPGGSAQP